MSLITVVQRAGELFSWRGEPIEVQSPTGVVWAFAEADDDELEARGRAGLGAMLDLELLAALTELPYGTPIRRDALDHRIRRQLDRAGTAIVERCGEWLTRSVRRPLRVNGAFAVGRWSSASRQVGPFGTLCPVGVITRHRPRPSGRPTVEAAVWGQGLVWWTPDDDVEVVQSAEPSLRLPGAYQWWLCEMVYASIVDGLTGLPTALSASRPPMPDRA